MTEVTKGTKFQSIYADSNAKWETVKYRGGNAWLCAITADNLDYVGTTKVFGTEEIKAAISREGFWNRIVDENTKWWDSRKVGEIVHYDNGFGSYVRGSVVEIDGSKKMVPTALVGKWSPHDLPRIQPNGTLSEGYHVGTIRERQAFQPNFSNMYELKITDDRWSAKGVDPRTLAEIDLSVPKSSAAQVEAKRLNAIIEEIHKAMSDRHSAIHGDDPVGYLRNVIKTVKTIVEDENV